MGSKVSAFAVTPSLRTLRESKYAADSLSKLHCTGLVKVRCYSQAPSSTEEASVNEKTLSPWDRRHVHLSRTSQPRGCLCKPTESRCLDLSPDVKGLYRQKSNPTAVRLALCHLLCESECTFEVIR